MRIIAFIHRKEVIEHILKHLGLSEEPEECANSPPSVEPPELTYEPIFDDLPVDEQIELARAMR